MRSGCTRHPGHGACEALGLFIDLLDRLSQGLLRDILDYKARDDKRRDDILRELTREAEDLGLYDR